MTTGASGRSFTEREAAFEKRLSQKGAGFWLNVLTALLGLLALLYGFSAFTPGDAFDRGINSYESSSVGLGFVIFAGLLALFALLTSRLRQWSPLIAAASLTGLLLLLFKMLSVPGRDMGLGGWVVLVFGFLQALLATAAMVLALDDNSFTRALRGEPRAEPATQPVQAGAPASQTNSGDPQAEKAGLAGAVAGSLNRMREPREPRPSWLARMSNPPAPPSSETDAQTTAATPAEAYPVSETAPIATQEQDAAAAVQPASVGAAYSAPPQQTSASEPSGVAGQPIIPTPPDGTVNDMSAHEYNATRDDAGSFDAAVFESEPLPIAAAAEAQAAMWPHPDPEPAVRVPDAATVIRRAQARFAPSPLFDGVNAEIPAYEDYSVAGAAPQPAFTNATAPIITESAALGFETEPAPTFSAAASPAPAPVYSTAAPSPESSAAAKAFALGGETASPASTDPAKGFALGGNPADSVGPTSVHAGSLTPGDGEEEQVTVRALLARRAAAVGDPNASSSGSSRHAR